MGGFVSANLHQDTFTNTFGLHDICLLCSKGQESKKASNLSNNQEIVLSAHQFGGKIQAWRDEPSCAAARSPVVF